MISPINPYAVSKTFQDLLAKNYFQMLLTSSLWGSSFLLMKLALVELTPFHISFYRIFIGMIFMNLFITKIDKYANNGTYRIHKYHK